MGEVTVKPPAVNAAPAASPAPAVPAKPAPISTSTSRKAANLHTSPQSVEQLVQACRSGDNESVKRLLAASVDPDGKSKDGTTPLLAAVAQGHLAIVQSLIGAGADPTIGNGSNNPMTVAFQKGHQ